MRLELTIGSIEIEYEVEVTKVPGYYTVVEAAEELGVSERRVRDFIAEGRLVAQKVGGMHLIADVELERFKSLPRKEGWRKGRPRK